MDQSDNPIPQFPRPALHRPTVEHILEEYVRRPVSNRDLRTPQEVQDMITHRVEMLRDATPRFEGAPVEEVLQRAGDAILRRTDLLRIPRCTGVDPSGMDLSDCVEYMLRVLDYLAEYHRPTLDEALQKIAEAHGDPGTPAAREPVRALHLWHDGASTASAYDAADAHVVAYDELGAERPEGDPPFSLVPDEQVLAIMTDDGRGLVTQTALQWAAEGRGLVAHIDGG